MMDALGEPQSVLVLGGSSEIALATVKALPRARLRRVVLAGRPSPALDAAAQELSAAGIAGVVTQASTRPTRRATRTSSTRSSMPVTSTSSCSRSACSATRPQAEADPDAAVTVATTNYTGAVSAGLRVATRLRAQGHGVLVVMSSVAGDRARRSNYVYGSTKAGLDAFAQGLGDALHGSGARVLVVRPGFVRTRMTEGMTEAPMTINPQDVARIIVTALRKGRETVYAPGPLRFVMAGLKTLPRPLFRKLPM